MCDKYATSYIIPLDQKIVGQYEFKECRYLKKLYVPFYVKEIPETNFVDRSGIFKDTYQLALTIVGERGTAAERCAKEAGIIFEVGDRIVCGDRLKAYFGQSPIVDISCDIRTIGYNAFCNAPHVKNINISTSVEYVDSEAFMSTDIEEIFIPQNVKSISSRTFKNCKKLACVVFENGNTGFEDDCFDGCGDSLVVKAPAGGFVEEVITKHTNVKFEKI